MSLSAITLLVAATLTNAPAKPVRFEDHLTTGVNITRWFCYLPEKPPADQFSRYLLPADFQNFKKLGIKYARLCISPDVIYRDGKPDAAMLKWIDRAVLTLTNNKIAVLWDLHDNGQMKLDSDPKTHQGFVDFWKAIATHYKSKNIGMMAFEPLNEPVFQKNPGDWHKLQLDTINAIRRIDKDRVIVATGTGWGGIDGLTQLKPLADKKLIYSFHCYDPFHFTHQGASWVGEQVAALKNMPYPSSPEAVREMATAETNKEKRDFLNWYGEQRYDKAYLRDRINKAIKYGKDNKVTVFMGEFGAYPPVSPPESRTRWFQDMRAVCDELKVRNAIWGYDDALGLGRSREGNSIRIDESVVKSFFKK